MRRKRSTKTPELMVKMDGSDNHSKLVQIQTGSFQDAAAAQAGLDNASGPEYWRSLEELAQNPGVPGASAARVSSRRREWQDEVSRRGFLS